MKRIYFGLAILMMSLGCNAQKSAVTDIDSLEQILIGEWEIDKVLDKDGNEVKSITRSMKGSPLGDEIQVAATGPKIILNSDKSYTMEFTPENIDTGKWFLESSDTIIFQLVTEKGTGAYEMLKSAAEMFGKTINYDSDGNIVENNPNLITGLLPNELILEYETDYFQVYKRTK